MANTGKGPSSDTEEMINPNNIIAVTFTTRKPTLKLIPRNEGGCIIASMIIQQGGGGGSGNTNTTAISQNDKDNCSKVPTGSLLLSINDERVDQYSKANVEFALEGQSKNLPLRMSFQKKGTFSTQNSNTGSGSPSPGTISISQHLPGTVNNTNNQLQQNLSNNNSQINPASSGYTSNSMHSNLPRKSFENTISNVTNPAQSQIPGQQQSHSAQIQQSQQQISSGQQSQALGLNSTNPLSSESPRPSISTSGSSARNRQQDRFLRPKLTVKKKSGIFSYVTFYFNNFTKWLSHIMATIIPVSTHPCLIHYLTGFPCYVKDTGFLTGTTKPTEENWISTQQFSAPTWLPLSMMLQLKRRGNIYILMVCVLTMTSYTTRAPIYFVLTFCFFLFATSIKNGYDDYRRFLSDTRINHSTCEVLSEVYYDSNGNVTTNPHLITKDNQNPNNNAHHGLNLQFEWQLVDWASISLGNIIRVDQDCQIPCDMIILATSCPRGEFAVSYVDTKSLDGESNLKPRWAPDTTQRSFAPLAWFWTNPSNDGQDVNPMGTAPRRVVPNIQRHSSNNNNQNKVSQSQSQQQNNSQTQGNQNNSNTSRVQEMKQVTQQNQKSPTSSPQQDNNVKKNLSQFTDPQIKQECPYVEPQEMRERLLSLAVKADSPCEHLFIFNASFQLQTKFDQNESQQSQSQVQQQKTTSKTQTLVTTQQTHVTQSGETGIFLENSIFRGCTLRNTEWVIGISTFVGQDTKIMLNSREPPDKMSDMQVTLNRLLSGLFVLVFATSMTIAILSYVWMTYPTDKRITHTYLKFRNEDDEPGPVVYVFTKFLGMIVLFSHAIPVSLYVALAVLKIILTHFLTQDKTMSVAPEDGDESQSDLCVTAKSTELIEELGQVEYIFSDKTGTLTCNTMVFQKSSINAIVYDIVPEQVEQIDFGRLILEQHGHAPAPNSNSFISGGGNNQNGGNGSTLGGGGGPGGLKNDGSGPSGVPLANQQVSRILGNPKHKEHENVRKFFLLLALCHTVVPSQKDGDFQGPSPDECALVKGCKECGLEFVEKRITARNGTCIKIRENVKGGEESYYRVLNVLEFTSERKCMSVVVQELSFNPWDVGSQQNNNSANNNNNQSQTNNNLSVNANQESISVTGGPDDKTNLWLKDSTKGLFLLVKGADSVVEKLLKNGNIDSQTAIQIGLFSRDGLRILMCASAKLEDDFYRQWAESYRAATSTLKNRHEKIEAAVQKLESIGLDLVGVSAIDDKLQDGVETSIEIIRRSDIKFWMLTGDKVETAIDIGYSCKLATKDMLMTRLAYLSDSREFIKACKSRLEELERRKIPKVRHCVAIDGGSVMFLTESMECRKLFHQMCTTSIACICCRLAPKQKAFLVNFVRKDFPGNPITLAIGDGANDVAMIQEAHIGIGVRGKEGSQAVQASDYAISQFRFLVPLLLTHGRGGYRRIASFLCYYFYKNICLCFGDVTWGILSGFSGQVAYPDYLVNGFNALWTSFTAFVVFAYDSDVPEPSVSQANAYLYKAGPTRAGFNYQVFGIWIVLAIYHGSVAHIIPFAYTGSHPVNADGHVPGLWWASVVSFSVIIWVVMGKLIMITLSWVFQNTVTIMFFTLFYIVSLYMLTLPAPFVFGSYMVMQIDVWGIVSDVFSSPLAYLIFLFVPLICLLPDYFLMYWETNIRPNPLQVQMYHCRIPLDPDTVTDPRQHDLIPILPLQPPTSSHGTTVSGQNTGNQGGGVNTGNIGVTASGYNGPNNITNDNQNNLNNLNQNNSNLVNISSTDGPPISNREQPYGNAARRQSAAVWQSHNLANNANSYGGGGGGNMSKVVPIRE